MRQFISYVFSNGYVKAQLSKLRLHLTLVWGCSVWWFCVTAIGISQLYIWGVLGCRFYEKMLSFFHELQALWAIFHIVPNYHNRALCFFNPFLSPWEVPLTCFPSYRVKSVKYSMESRWMVVVFLYTISKPRPPQ